MDFTKLASLASGHIEARIVQTAVELHIFDALGGPPQVSGAVARKLSLNPRATDLLMNALAALELLEKNGTQFSLAPVSRQYLVRGSPEYLGGLILFDASLWNSWEKLSVAIRSGNPVRTPDMYQHDPAETEVFIQAMDSLVKARGDAEAIMDFIDFTKVTRLLDIGSGPATYPIALCRTYPTLEATIFDLPGTLEITRRYVQEAGLTERIQLVLGDYRTDSIPGTYELIFLSNVIHGENEEKNAALFDRLFLNLTDGGRLVIKDHILDESRAKPRVGAIFSLLMLLTTDGGRCYSFNEIRSWMEHSGLAGVQLVDLPPPFTSSLVIGVK
jgi:hypothetical protein